MHQTELVILACAKGHTWGQRLESDLDEQDGQTLVKLHLIRHCPHCGRLYTALWLG